MPDRGVKQILHEETECHSKVHACIQDSQQLLGKLILFFDFWFGVGVDGTGRVEDSVQQKGLDKDTHPHCLLKYYSSNHNYITD